MVVEKQVSTTRAPAVRLVGASTLSFASEAPKALGLQVRRSSDVDEAADAQLKASIRAHGIICPLLVANHGGKAYVVAGNRRLRLFRELASEHGPASFALVPTVGVAEFGGDAREVAMATNVSLPPHPVDRYEVISVLAKKLTAGDVQARFGMTPRQYDQVMKLGALSPKIRDAWREGRITAEVAQAFTLAEPKDQERIFDREIKEAHQGRMQNAHHVRQHVVGKQGDIGPLVEFLGADEIEKAGVVIRRDLFGSHHVAADPAKVRRMAERKLTDLCDRLVMQGWSWAQIADQAHNRWSYSRVEPTKMPPRTADEKAGMGSAEGAYSEAQKRRSGVFLSVAADGSLKAEFGMVRPEDSRKARTQEAKAKKKATAPGKERAEIPGTLVLRLSEQLRAGVAAAVEADPRVGVAALIAGFAAGSGVVSVRVGAVPREFVEEKKRTATFVGTFAAALKMSPTDQMATLAKVAAAAIDTTCHGAAAWPMTADRTLHAIVEALKPDVLRGALSAAFDADGYFSSIPMPEVLAAVEDMGDPQAAARLAKGKKGDAAAHAARAAKARGWLPTWLRAPGHAAAKVEGATKGGKRR